MKIGSLNLRSRPVMLAPMENITDAPYRAICRQHGADMVFTEFIASEGLCRQIDKSRLKGVFLPKERPLGIQIFGHDPENMAQAAAIMETLEPDVIDLNFGCPVKKVVAKGGGAALLKDLPLMEKIARSVVQAVSLPVTAKTRLGWDHQSVNATENALRLQDAGISMVTMHGRTRSQMYKGKADWDAIGRITEHPDWQIPLTGNGDISSAQNAKNVLEKYPVDGIMVGRAAMGYPWIFSEIREMLDNETAPSSPSIHSRVEVCREYLTLSIPAKGEQRAIFETRKHYKNFFRDIYGFKPYRIKLYNSLCINEIHNILDEIKERLHTPDPIT